MKLAILDCATLPPELKSGFQSVGALVQAWLAPHLPEAEMATIRIGYGAPFPELAEFDAYLVPGSKYGVYDETPWMAPLRTFLNDARAAGKPLLGICFGHQIMADTFGGKAAKAGHGLCVGVRRFEVAGQEIRTQVCHQDQVVEVPPGARVIGGADYCVNGVIEYDFPAMSMQFHPEYPEEFVLGIVEEVEGDLLTPEQAKAARRDAGKPVTNAVFAAEAAAFYRRYLNPAA